MAAITSPDYPGERLIVCRNPDLARERARKREDLLAATEKDLAVIAAAVRRARKPLRGEAAIALKVGAVVNRRKMAKHFDLVIGEANFALVTEKQRLRSKDKRELLLHLDQIGLQGRLFMRCAQFLNRRAPEIVLRLPKVVKGPKGRK